MLVAWGNLYVLATAGNPARVIEFGRSHGWSEALQSLFFGAVAGLLTAEVVIQAYALAPGGRFPDPLRAMVTEVCFGAMLYGAIQTFVYDSLFSG